MPGPSPTPHRTTTLLAALLLLVVGPGCVSWDPLILPALRALLGLVGSP